MVARARTEESLDTQRVLGQLLEAHRASTEERQEAREERVGMRSSVEKLSDFVSNLQRSVDNLENTMKTTTKELMAINAGRLGERLDALELRTSNLPKIEREFAFWTRIGGVGWGLVWRLGGVLAGSGAVSAIVAYIVK